MSNFLHPTFSQFSDILRAGFPWISFSQISTNQKSTERLLNESILSNQPSGFQTHWIRPLIQHLRPSFGTQFSWASLFVANNITIKLLFKPKIWGSSNLYFIRNKYQGKLVQETIFSIRQRRIFFFLSLSLP